MNLFTRVMAFSLVSGLLCITTSLAQITRYVSTTGTTAPASATTWANSTTDLQGAITSSQPGDQVWVAAGVYKPISGQSYSMKAGVSIYGGFAGNETDLRSRPSVNPVASRPSGTTLLGNGSRVITNSASLSLTNTAVLDGFVITGGGNVSQGGGMLNNRSSPTLLNCLFIGNKAAGPGGRSNNVASGGAIQNDGSSPVLINCSLQSNSVTASGEIYNVVYGGAIFNNDSSPVLTNCSLLSNQVAASREVNNQAYGGAICNVSGSRVVLTNCSMQSNSVTASGGSTNEAIGEVIFNVINSSALMTNCIMWNNGADNTLDNSTLARYCLFDNTVNGYSTGPGNLTTATSPFASTTSVALAACSPAINAGNPASQTVTGGPYSETALPQIDLAGNPRIVGNRVDMGAVEYVSQSNVPLMIVQQPVAGSVVCAGSSVVMSASATGSSPTYQWYKDGQILTSATTSSLTLTNVSATGTGRYSVVVSGDCPSLTSTAFSLKVNDPTAFTVTSATVCQSQAVSLSASGCSSGTVRWSTGYTGTVLSVTAGVSTSVLTATCTIGSCSGLASGSVVVSQVLPPQARILSLRTDESGCPVRLVGQGVGTVFVFTGPGEGYVFSNVFRNGGIHDLLGLSVKKPGTYTLRATYTNECGSSVPVSQSVMVSKACP